MNPKDRPLSPHLSIYRWPITMVSSILHRSWAFFYHLANGIRHLVWDAGHGFEKEHANASAWFVIVASVVLTLVFWMVVT